MAYEKNCIFCKIVLGKLPSYKIWEDEEFLAILDIYPVVKGQALVITKKHYDSYVFDMPNDVYTRFLIATKKVAKLLDKKLNVKRTAMVMEGLGINHAHIKLYPLHGLKKKFEQVSSHDERIWFEKHPGYICTKLGLPANPKELKELTKIIKEK